MSRHFILLFGIVLFFSELISAQTGTLRGKIFDKKSGETLIGATVMLPGTTIGISTDFDGNYSLTLPVGEHQISYSYISYEKKLVSGVKIKNGEVTILNISLGEVSLDINAVVVTAKASQRTENALQILQKKAPKLIDGISAEQISKLGDSNAAEALKRVTGISVQDGKYVFVRGLSERYTKVTFNHAEIPALDPDKNTVQLDIFPSNIIDNIVVNKTFTPDISGESTGGLVNIITKDFPEKFTFQFSTKFSYNPQANLNDNFLSYKGGNNDWLGSDDGTRDIPTIADKALNTMIKQNYNQINQVYFSTEDLNKISNSFSTQMSPVKQRSFLNHNEKISIGDQVRFLKKALGYNISLSYETSFNYYDDGIFGEYEDATTAPRRKVNDTKGEKSNKIAGLINFNYKLNNENKLGVRYFHNQSGKSIARFRDGYFAYEDSYNQDRTLAYVQRNFNNFQLHGKHIALRLNKSAITWFSAYTNMKQEEPDLRFFENLYDIEGNDTTFRTKTNDKPARYFRSMNEINFSNKINVEIPTTLFTRNSKIKIGGSYDYKSRNFDDIKFDLFSSSTNLPNGNIEYYLKNSIVSTTNPLGYYYTTDHFQNLNNSQDAYLKIMAAYFMLDMHISKKLRIVTGARVESSQLHTENKIPDNSSLRVNRTKDFINILPSLNLTYSLIENMNLRFAYSQTIARPSFKEIGPSYYDFQAGEKIYGNPDLKITSINNFDIRWEYFFKQGEKIALSGFYKYFKNAIEKKLAVDVNNREFFYENSKPITLYGIELEFRKKLDFISFLKNFIVGGNFSYIKSIYKIPSEELAIIRASDPDRKDTRPMQGQAPYIVNAFINYRHTKTKIDANLSFNVSGEKLELLTQKGTPYGYELPEPSLNFNISKSFARNFNIELSIKNILNTDYAIAHHYKSGDEYYLKYSKGRNFGISFKYLIK